MAATASDLLGIQTCQSNHWRKAVSAAANYDFDEIAPKTPQKYAAYQKLWYSWQQQGFPTIRNQSGLNPRKAGARWPITWKPKSDQSKSG